MERTWRLPMVTQPVCRPKKVLEQQSRLPTSRPPTSARTVSTGSSPFPEQPSACLPRAQSTASAHGHEAQPRSPGQYIACLGSTERRLRHQTPDLPTLNSCAFSMVAANAWLFAFPAEHLAGCSYARAAAARKRLCCGARSLRAYGRVRPREGGQRLAHFT